MRPLGRRAVGGLSVLNAIAGANSENLPVICVRSPPPAAFLQYADCLTNTVDRPGATQITGGINSNDKGTNHILHHTIGRSDSTEQEIEAFRPFVCHAVRTGLLFMWVSLVVAALRTR